MDPKDVDRMANSVDPDQTAPSEEVWSGTYTRLFKYLESSMFDHLIPVQM